MTDARSYVAVCAGAGIGCEGFRTAGFTPKLFIEWSAVRQEVLRHNHPGVQIEGDLVRISAEQVPPSDVWFATLPCQPYSVRGKGEGLKDPRGGSMLESFVRLLAECQARGCDPRFILFENVPGWLDPTKRSAEAMLEALAQLGYRPIWGENLCGLDFGVPQDRWRVFVLLCRADDYARLAVTVPELPPRPALAQPVKRLEAWEFGCLLPGPAVEEICYRVYEASGKSAPSMALETKLRAFVGAAACLPGWDRLVVYHSRENPRSFQAGFSPTILKSPRMVVRLPSTGAIHTLLPEGLERLMGVRRGLTALGRKPDGNVYQIEGSAREAMLGDGVCAPVVDWLARVIDRLLTHLA